MGVAPPDGFPVEGLPNSDLRRELRWYFEAFLDYPFDPETGHAERVLTGMKAWGTQAFEALFSDRRASNFYHDATRDGHTQLKLRVTADDPRIFAWPWEALHDPQYGYLAQHCHIERHLTNAPDPLALPEHLPQDRINILLVTARPFKRDVNYRSISRPLVDLIAEHKLPAEVTLLRPPTFDRLREVLTERPGYFHVLHFDGHGGYGPPAEDPDQASALLDAVDPHVLQGSQGSLVFETPEGKPDAVPAETLSTLLREHRLPAMVLNACQSATIDEHAENAFASIAASAVRAGARSVVAMGYSLYVSAAQQFLPAFYRELFRTGDLDQATRAGRQQMLAQPGRLCARGRFPLQDWLVPVVYQQQPADFGFVREAAAKVPRQHQVDESRLPVEALDRENPYGFIGRDSAILDIERAMQRPPPAILIHGLGGVGKTTLARGFLGWLDQTAGLGDGCLWLSFHDIRSSDYVLNRLGEWVLGAADIPTWSTQQKLDALGRAFHDKPLVLVWDNFESASGNAAAGIDPLLPTEDLQTLADFLRRLRGGKTKVIITSRSDESWLAPELRRRIELAGLHGEERWEFVTAVIDGLGVTVDREDKHVKELMDALDGHPLLMRAILPRLEHEPPNDVLKGIQRYIAEGDPSTTATLRFVEEKLPEELHPLLLPLALHERFADASLIESMAKALGDGMPYRAAIDRLFSALAAAGLARHLGHLTYELHPALSGHLRTSALNRAGAEARDAWSRAFVEVMGEYADTLASRPTHEQRAPFHLHQANLYHASELAEHLGMDAQFSALTQALAAYAQNTRSLDAAERLFRRLADHSKTHGVEVIEATGYHHLGAIAQERHDLDRAEDLYHMSLAIEEKHGNEPGVASTYHQLGMIAQERRDLDGAEDWYLKSLAISEQLNTAHGVASTYHQLGVIAQRRHDLDGAEDWYLKSLAIDEQLNAEHNAAKTYHQLGTIAQERHDLDRAEGWYGKSLAISKKLGNEHDAASTYHEMGMIAEDRNDLDGAEALYRMSLAIEEKFKDEGGAATTYLNLGMIAQRRHDLERADAWYRKALAIKERLRDEHGAANTIGQLGIVAGLREQFDQSGRWLIKSVRAFKSCRDEAGAARGTQNFVTVLHRAPADEQRTLRAMWEEAGLGLLPAEGADHGTGA